MLTKEEVYYYDRQILLDTICMEGQLRLKKSKVVVIGAGGLGCPALRYLSAAGIGVLGVIDFDTVTVTNLHRQILYDYSDIGKNKAIVSKEKLEKINPFIKIEAFSEALSVTNCLEILNNYDVVVDCTDNYETRFLVNDACVLLNKPLVYGSIYKFEGQVSVFNWNDGPTYRCLFKDFPSEESTTDCNAAGVLGVLPGLIGVYQANEVLKLILGIGEVLSEKLMILNGLTNQNTLFKINRSNQDIYTELLSDNQLHQKNYIRKCSSKKNESEIESSELFDFLIQKNIQIVDVRSPFEDPVLECDRILNIPLDELYDRHKEIDPNKMTLLLCKSGIRSLKALEILQNEFGYKKIKSLKGGLTEDIIELLNRE
jgi:molybdopterin/thiamine biosynthesis adenylyltransferase/rhodanese-related sulfurtransferase